MNKLKALLTAGMQEFKYEEGQDLVEYGLLGMLILIVSVVIVSQLAPIIITMFNAMTAGLQ